MPPAPTARTLLAQLIRQKRWTVDDFVRAFNKAGRQSGPDGEDHTISRRQATRWVGGRLPSLPHPASRRVLETMFATDAEVLLAPPDAPVRDRSLTAEGVAVAASASDHEQTGSAPSEEVGSSRRRDLLGAGVLLTATGSLIDPVTRAAGISRAIAASTPDPLTLAQLQHGIHQLTTRYALTPHAELVGPIERAWDNAEALLETRVTGTSRTDLELVAGQYAYYRGQLAFDMGDEQTALTFLVLAAQHANAAGDSLLSGSVAVMRSSCAFFSGDFGRSAALAQQGQAGAHPYVAPLLAGCLARALAQLGHADGAMAALGTLHDTVWDGASLPGPNVASQEFYEAFSAITLSYLGRGDEAEQHARTSLQLVADSGRHVQAAGSQLALARAFLRRPAPDPEQAAGAVTDALRVAAGNDHGRTTIRATAIYRRLIATPGWAGLPAIRDLASHLPASPHALPAAAAV
ncbi:hypothetical protein [Pseudofrankia sp. DC12]|uniref:hypothetical protein n=1 Tax=Pseudofrankia sp. DC12 TaxID=683315 RepID=UPI0005F837C6|nr:hypothetical protein [Pseudofrankia sp. DC12]